METSWIIGGSIAIAVAVVLVAVGIWYIYKTPTLNSVLTEHQQAQQAQGGQGRQRQLQTLSASQIQQLKEESSGNQAISTALIIVGFLVGGPAGIFLVSQGVLRR